MELSIVIVNWNARELLTACLRALDEHPFTGESETIVVDSASTDGSVDAVRAGFPKVRVIALSENMGFAAGNNAGLRVATGRWRLLLNPDTEVHAGALDALVAYGEAHPEAWGVGPRLLGTRGELQRTGVRFPSVWRSFVETVFLDRLFPTTRLFGAQRELWTSPDRARRVDYVQGSCLLIREAALERVGLLDEGYFLYFEETDWCRRCADAGGEVHYTPSATVTHHGGGGDAHYGEKRLVLYHESFLRYIHLHMRGQELAMRLVLLKRTTLRLSTWMAIAVTRTTDRANANSSVRGYWRVLELLLGGKRSKAQA